MLLFQRGELVLQRQMGSSYEWTWGGEKKKEERKILTEVNLLALKQTQLSESKQDFKPRANSLEEQEIHLHVFHIAKGL